MHGKQKSKLYNFWSN